MSKEGDRNSIKIAIMSAGMFVSLCAQAERKFTGIYHDVPMYY